MFMVNQIHQIFNQILQHRQFYDRLFPRGLT